MIKNYKTCSVSLSRYTETRNQWNFGKKTRDFVGILADTTKCKFSLLVPTVCQLLVLVLFFCQVIKAQFLTNQWGVFFGLFFNKYEMSPADVNSV